MAQNKSHSHPNRLPLQPRAPMTQEQEQEILLRVEQTLTQTIQKPNSPSEKLPPQANSSFVSWSWMPNSFAFAGGGLAFLVLLAFGGFWWTKTSSLPPIQQQGQPFTTASTIQFPSHQKSWFAPTYRPQTLRVPAQKTSKLRIPEQWSIRASGKTTLQIQHRTQNSIDLFLKRGHIFVELTSKTSQRFSIRTPFAQVQAATQGRFSVWCGSRWVRIHVYRGKIQVKQQQRFSLTSQRGIRITSRNHSRYHVPTQPSFSQQIRLFRRSLPQLTIFAKDLVEAQRISPQQRSEYMYQAVDYLQRKRAWKQAEQILLQITSLPLSPQAKEQALFDAARSCWKQTQTQRCKRLLQRYLQHHPKGRYIEEIRYQQARLCQPKENAFCQQLARTYLRHHPNGLHARTLRNSWLVPSKKTPLRK